MISSKHTPIFLSALMALCIALPCMALEGEEKPVTIKTIARAESDIAIAKIYAMTGLGKFLHLRAPTPMDNQTVIRMNRDTLYSSTILDLTKPAAITMPETRGHVVGVIVPLDIHAFNRRLNN